MIGNDILMFFNKWIPIKKGKKIFIPKYFLEKKYNRNKLLVMDSSSSWVKTYG